MYDSPRRADPAPRYSPEGNRYYAALADVDYAADLAKSSSGVPEGTLINIRNWAADEAIDASRYYTPDTPRRGNPNLSSGQFGVPTPRWDADGVLAMPDYLKRDLDDVPMSHDGVLAMPDHLKKDLDDLDNR